MVKTLLFQCREHGSIPDQKTKISHAVQPIKKNQYSLTFLGSLDLLENLVKALDLFPRKIIHKHSGCYNLFVILAAKSSLTLCDSLTVAARLLCQWHFPGKNTRVGSYFLLQGIFLTQGLNPCLLHWQVDSLPLSHLGSPAVLYTYMHFIHGFLKPRLRTTTLSASTAC